MGSCAPQAHYAPTNATSPTVLEGDIVFVNKLAYDLNIPFTTHRLAQWANPARGDIVVCFSPESGGFTPRLGPRPVFGARAGV